MTAFYIRHAAPSSSSPLFRRNLVWSYRLMSCRDTLPLFFDNDQTDSVTDREQMVGCHSSRQRSALSRRETLECRRASNTETVWVTIAPPEKSMRTASAPDKWNVSHRPVVYGHLFTVLSQCQARNLSRTVITRP